MNIFKAGTIIFLFFISLSAYALNAGAPDSRNNTYNNDSSKSARIIHEQLLNLSEELVHCYKLYARLREKNREIYDIHEGKYVDKEIYDYFDRYENNLANIEYILAEVDSYILLNEKIYDFYDIHDLLIEKHRRTNITNSDFILELSEYINSQLLSPVYAILTHANTIAKKLGNRYFIENPALHNSLKIAEKHLENQKRIYQDNILKISLEMRKLQRPI